MNDQNTLFLMYHELELARRPLCQVDNGYTRYVLPLNQFKQHLEFLCQQGFQGSSVSETLTFTHNPSKKIGLTFDDGCETDLIAAAPLLKSYNFNATFFIVAGFIDTPGYLSLSQLRELADLGFEIGSHSMSHRFLPDLSQADATYEIQQSKIELEQLLGLPVHHFSCPGGRWNQLSVQIVKESGYLTMSTSQIGLVYSTSNYFSLARIPMMRSTSLTDLQKICSGKGIAYQQARENLLHLSKSLLGNTLYEKVRSKLLNAPM
jgi:peptidoglycan/xylan/chitin deacetylase (PgdA/CDA1 family)